jgi:formyl-CoA transferase
MHGKDYWVETLLANGIPAGPILSYPEAFGSEHAKVRGMRMEIDHPVEGKVPNIGFAVKLSGTPQQVRRHPPLLGEHTEEVLAEAGLAGGEIERLREQGAFGS